MAGGFVKIYGDRLLGSSLMDEAVETRWMFMVLAAAANEEGYIRCQTVGAAARLANLTEAQASMALDALSSPDSHSSTPDHDGRRILRAEGGWTLVNHRKYRELRTESQAKKTERQRKWRLKKASTVDGVDGVRPEVSASASPSVVFVKGGVGGTAPANPLLEGRRPQVESDGYRLIREIADLEPDRDPLEILMEAAGWETKDGRFRTKCRLETMTDDHLIRTIRDLKTNLAEARAHGTKTAK